ncbi:hypothetical protein GQX74_011505 [Glossina fuscipes]|nr:hypothetical protein GQX74_011505 [Glossina fuscipes]
MTEIFATQRKKNTFCSYSSAGKKMTFVKYFSDEDIYKIFDIRNTIQETLNIFVAVGYATPLVMYYTFRIIELTLIPNGKIPVYVSKRVQIETSKQKLDLCTGIHAAQNKRFRRGAEDILYLTLVVSL